MTDRRFTFHYYCDEVTVTDEDDCFTFCRRECEAKERTWLFEANREAMRRLHQWLGERLASGVTEDDDD